jgi:hypothetical protein
MQLLKTDGTTQEYDDNTLEGMQAAVGGYIQIVNTKDGKLMVMNEEGKLEGLEFNETATEMVELFPGDYVAGNVLIAEQNEID